ncbi:hypothetical protein BMF35_a0207 [Aurantiacibacter gangjinensis]|uniref:Uncharacterized protein n=1 Tax=Aurantiacibacter gangjinensis TaxID=502682 RepID=A0A0G9MRV0_9SPHN|nr:hypothetical protein BMF35_a0207 [Aurantiacibacter gangjinensis]KLE33471.1 hypothetical protein AAW01_06030 [Aurantiacibacter gangjinensis]
MAPLLAVLLLACGAGFADHPSDGPQSVVLEMPDGAEDKLGSEKQQRFSTLRDELRTRALQEAADLGEAPVGFGEQIGHRGDRLLIGAVGPQGGVFYAIPFFGEFPGPDGDDPWTMLRQDGVRDVFDACRFTIRADDLPAPHRFADRWRFTNLWADPNTCVPQMAGDTTPIDPHRPGYRIFRHNAEVEPGIHLAVVELPDGYSSDFNPDTALDTYAGARTITRSMALPLFGWHSGFADLADGARLFIYAEAHEWESAAACVIEGLDWQRFREFDRPRTARDPLREWCRGVLSQHRQAMRQRRAERFRSMPPPVIQTTPVD